MKDIGIGNMDGRIKNNIQGGEKRMVQIEEVMEMKKKVMIIDEKKNEMDEKNMERMIEII